jgi:hypothetical protein
MDLGCPPILVYPLAMLGELSPLESLGECYL